MKQEQIIFNDPIYGFITINDPLICDIINHRYFQRLRRVKQLGLTYLVYPGALHTRFQHVIGALHLMQQALEVLRRKGVEITDDEFQAACIAILLHDIGHNPFSHALEGLFVEGVDHEDISILIMEKLNLEFNGQLDLCLKVFKNEYKKHFLHQLVSSQLDTDRLDYLNRDTFYTAVAEGHVGVERIIQTLNVVDGELVFEEKGIHSITSFLFARSTMYSQVYLHKTVLSAEQILARVVLRAKALYRGGKDLFLTAGIRYFFEHKVSLAELKENDEALEMFINCDDDDLLTCMKEWCRSEDIILATLCQSIIYRRLFRVELQDNEIEPSRFEEIKRIVKDKISITDEDVQSLVFTGETLNRMYNIKHENINILMKQGSISDIAKKTDHFNLSSLSRPVKKYYLCYPKEFVEV